MSTVNPDLRHAPLMDGTSLSITIVSIVCGVVSATDAENSSSGNSGHPSPNLGLATFGSALSENRRARNRIFKNLTDVGISVTTVHTRAEGDWRRLQDEIYYMEDARSNGGSQAIYTSEVERTRTL